MKYLTACCTVKNEAAHILEWMAFHKTVGFDHLIIIDHNSEDETSKVVSSFQDQDSVTLIRWNKPGTQMDMYNHVVSEFRDKFLWCAFLDADEFLYSTETDDVRHVLTEYEKFGAIGVYWLIYGSSGHIHRPSGLTIENYVQRSESNFVINSHIKSIVNLSEAGLAETSHMFATSSNTVDENYRNLPFRPPHGFIHENVPTHARLRINHYHTRSQQDYAVKAARRFFGDDKLGTPERKQAMFDQHDRNEVEDRTALRHARLTRFQMGLPTA